MKRFVLSVFLLFAGLSIFAQSYDDWNKLFTENRKNNIQDTYIEIGNVLDKTKQSTEIYAIFMLYFEKCEITYIEKEEHKNDLHYKMTYNTDYEICKLTYDNFEKDIEIFLSYIKEHNLSLFGVSDFQKYNISKEIPIVSVRNITILPGDYEGKLIQLQCDYKYVYNDLVCFEYFDDFENKWKDFFANYDSSTAKQLAHIQDKKFNNKYALFGEIKNRHFIIEYIEHID